MADEIDELGFGDIAFNLADLDSAKAHIAVNGLPHCEQNFLFEAGFDQSFVDSLTDMHLVVDTEDIGPTTVSGILRQAADKYSDDAIEILIQYPPFSGGIPN